MKRLLNISVLSSLLFSSFATLDINCMHRRMFKKSYQRRNHMSRRREPKKVKPRVIKKAKTSERRHQKGQQYTSARDSILQKIKDARRQRRNRIRAKRYMIKRAKQVFLSQITDKVMKIITHACRGENGLTQKFGVSPQDLLTDFMLWLKHQAENSTEEISTQSSGSELGLLRLFILFLVVTRGQSFTTDASTGPNLDNGNTINCNLIDNSLIDCSRISSESKILKTGNFNLTVPFAGKFWLEEDLDGNRKRFSYFSPEHLDEEDMNAWWKFIKNHTIPVCSYNQEKDEVECDFSQSKKINVEEMQRINKQEGQNLNQRLYKIGINREIARRGLDPDSCAQGITSGEPQQLTQEEIDEIFPNYRGMCKNGAMERCPDIRIFYFPLNKRSSAFFRYSRSLGINTINIPYSHPGDSEFSDRCYQNSAIPHETGHIKSLEKKVGLHRRSACLDCNSGETVKTIKDRFNRMLERNGEFEADFWGALQESLHSQDTKAVFRFAAKYLKLWAETPMDYFFAETRSIRFPNCICENYHPSDKVRAAALAEFATKMDVLLDYLNS